MKVKLFHDKDIKETSIDIRYDVIDYRLKQILQIAQTQLPMLKVIKANKQYQLDIADVFYIDTVDRELFVYTKDEIYSSQLTLRILSEQYEQYGLVRVNKYTIVNAFYVKAMELKKQMKYIITLDNGEMVELSRSYREDFFTFIDNFYQTKDVLEFD